MYELFRLLQATEGRLHVAVDFEIRVGRLKFAYSAFECSSSAF